MDFQIFYDLLRVALGNQKCLSKTPTAEEWAWLLDVAEKQAVDGITYGALEVLTQHGQKPTEDVKLDWFSFAEEIKSQNRLVNQRCKEVTELFAKAGFKTCILKGQGNGLMYKDGDPPTSLLREAKEPAKEPAKDPTTSLPREANDMPKETLRLGMLRVPGDIDIWVKGSKDEIIRFCRSKVGETNISHHHVEFPIFDDIPVEVHFIPSYSVLSRYNKRLQKFFESFQTEDIHGVDEKGNDYSLIIPEKKVNLVFQLSHMMRHFFYGGIGLRQMIDYYYLLRLGDPPTSLHREAYKKEMAETFEYLGLRKFAGAVMWIMKEVLGMDEKYLIVAPDEKRGIMVLSEMMEGGNFGQYDGRWTKKLYKKSWTMSVITRNIKLIPLFPEEAILTPIMGAYRFLRLKYGK